MQYKTLVLIFSLLAYLPFGEMTQTDAEEDMNKIKNKSFAMFLSHFELVEAPLSFNAKELNEYFLMHIKTNEESIPYELTKKYIPSNEDYKFSRTGPPIISPVARFYPQENVVGIVYSSRRFKGNSNNYHFELKVFDLNGKELNKSKDKGSTLVIGFKNIDSSKSFSLDSGGIVWTKEYENIWENEKMKGHPKEKIIAYKEKDSQAFLKCSLNGCTRTNNSNENVN